MLVRFITNSEYSFINDNLEAEMYTIDVKYQYQLFSICNLLFS